MTNPQKPTVLLIEDDPDQIFMYQSKFELEGYEFISARKGDEGMDLAKTEKPDIILLDLVLIVENGLDVLEKLKQDKVTQMIPVVVLTNLVKKEAMKKSRDLGAVGFLVKTNTVPADVVWEVQKILANR